MSSKMMLSLLLTVLFLLGFTLPQAQSSSFLAPSEVDRSKVEQSLMALLGQKNTDRLDRVKALLRPTYGALPKASVDSDKVDDRVARYALHRYFIVQHGWYVKGLSPDSAPATENTTSPLATVLKAKMPTLILELLEAELGSQQMGLDDLAVLVATIEDLVHGDAMDLLKASYQIHNFDPRVSLYNYQVQTVLDTFTLYFVAPRLMELSQKRFMNLLQQPERLYPGWFDTMLWIEDLRLSANYEYRQLHPFGQPEAEFSDESTTFAELSLLADKIMGGFGRFSDLECKAMKSDLLELEDGRQDGRVRLGKFYQPALTDGHMHFSESPEYLRHLGALDESGPGQASVIIPNIMYARSNCLATSGFHSICCIDACEGLMSDLEVALNEPFVHPDRLEKVVSGLSSETVEAPRQLSAALKDRLYEIASRHNGRVPLHGRLFGQWMHFAFPNECPYPKSLLSSEAAMSTHEWRQHWNSTKSSRASLSEMIDHVNEIVGSEGSASGATAGSLSSQDNASGIGAGLAESDIMMMWSDDEVLLSDLAYKQHLGGSGTFALLRTALRALAMVAAVCAALYALFENVKSCKGPAQALLRDDCGILSWFAGANADTNYGNSSYNNSSNNNNNNNSMGRRAAPHREHNDGGDDDDDDDSQRGRFRNRESAYCEALGKQAMV